jgi:hypothetical protein
MKTIALTQGYVAKVDDEDFDFLNQFKWWAAVKKAYKKIYVRPMAYINNVKTYMHRFILNPLPGLCVDHINFDALDNRKSNLRICTNQENVMHSRPIAGSSIYKGVYFDKEKKKWRAEITLNGKKCFRRRFESQIAAAVAYDTKARELFGEFAYLNFPDHISTNEVNDFIYKLNGRIFKVVFVKRSNSQIREMLCRTGVSRNIKGAGLKFEPSERNLLNVYDVQEKEYRFINLDSVIAIKTGGQKYYIT